MPKFEVFDPQEAPRVKQPLVSLQRKGTFTMNKAAYLALGQPAAVELLYDRDKRIMGFRPVDPSKGTAYAVRATEPSGSYAIAGVAFVKHYDIDTTTARRWPARVESGVLCVRLDDPAAQEVGREARAKLEAIGKARTVRRQ